jgi:hypothetical protein
MGPVIFVWNKGFFRFGVELWMELEQLLVLTAAIAASYIRKRVPQFVLRHLGRLGQVIFKT